jgi:hypothetical protein
MAQPNNRGARLRGPGAEDGEAVVADLRRGDVPPGVPRGGVVHRDPARRRQAGTQHLLVLGDEIAEPGGQQLHHSGELLPRVGFIVTNLTRPAESVVAFYNHRGTAEQWIKEGKPA